MTRSYRVEVFSTDDPRNPTQVEQFESQDHDQAQERAAAAVAAYGNDPASHYAVVWAEVDGSAAIEYVACVELPAGWSA